MMESQKGQTRQLIQLKDALTTNATYSRCVSTSEPEERIPAMVAFHDANKQGIMTAASICLSSREFTKLKAFEATLDYYPVKY